jgi:ABC transporter
VFASLYSVPASRAHSMLTLVGLDDKAGTRTEKLSGGEAQRLSIACALVHDQELVFLADVPGAVGGVFSDQSVSGSEIIEVGRVSLIDRAPPQTRAAFDRALKLTHGDDLAAALESVRKGDVDGAVLPMAILLGFALVVTLVAARLFRWEADCPSSTRRLQSPTPQGPHDRLQTASARRRPALVRVSHRSLCAWVCFSNTR